MSRCTTTHPLYTRSTNIFGTSIPEAIMRPNPRAGFAAGRAPGSPGRHCHSTLPFYTGIDCRAFRSLHLLSAYKPSSSCTAELTPPRPPPLPPFLWGSQRRRRCWHQLCVILLPLLPVSVGLTVPPRASWSGGCSRSRRALTELGSRWRAPPRRGPAASTVRVGDLKSRLHTNLCTSSDAFRCRSSRSRYHPNASEQTLDRQNLPENEYIAASLLGSGSRWSALNPPRHQGAPSVRATASMGTRRRSSGPIPRRPVAWTRSSECQRRHTMPWLLGSGALGSRCTCGRAMLRCTKVCGGNDSIVTQFLDQMELRVPTSIGPAGCM